MTKSVERSSRASRSDLSEQFNRAHSRLVLQSSDLPLGTLSDMVESGAIDLQPSFQRRERWKAEDQSSLIESFLLNVPVPPIYLSEERDGTYTAIDGKQRLNAINQFMNDRLSLTSIEGFKSASGYRFSEMSDDIKNAFKLKPFLRVITLLNQTDSDLKYEVFLRLNRGGETLNDQEIRNVAYRGNLNDLVYYLAGNEFLRGQLKIRGKESSAYRKMDDAEYVLRFMTLAGNWRKFSGRMGREMDRFMSRNQYISADELDYTKGHDDRPTWAHSRIPMDVMVCGWTRSFRQFSQAASMMAS